MPAYAPSPVRYTSAFPLVAVYSDASLTNAGALAGVRYFNPATEVYEAGPFDPSKHVVPLVKAEDAGPFKNDQLLYFLVKALSSEEATVSVVPLDADGNLGTPVEHLTCIQCKIFSSLPVV